MTSDHGKLITLTTQWYVLSAINNNIMNGSYAIYINIIASVYIRILKELVLTELCI